MKNSDLFFWFFFALRAWAWNFKKAQSAPAFCLFSHKFKSHAKAFCLVKFRAKCARLALTNAPQKRPFITNYSVNFNANSTQILANSATFLLNFAYNFTNSHFKAYR